MKHFIAETRKEMVNETDCDTMNKCVIWIKLRIFAMSSILWQTATTPPPSPLRQGLYLFKCSKGVDSFSFVYQLWALFLWDRVHQNYSLWFYLPYLLLGVIELTFRSYNFRSEGTDGIYCLNPQLLILN